METSSIEAWRLGWKADVGYAGDWKGVWRLDDWKPVVEHARRSGEVGGLLSRQTCVPPRQGPGPALDPESDEASEQVHPKLPRLPGFEPGSSVAIFWDSKAALLNNSTFTRH